MSIAAKCICGESLYYCVGVGKCPYTFFEPLTDAFLSFMESKERVKKQGQQELIKNLKHTTVILPR